MKAREFVMVYEKPYTEEKPEGIACLVRPVPKDEAPYSEQGLEYWEVMFIEDQEEQTVTRLVGPKSIELP